MSEDSLLVQSLQSERLDPCLSTAPQVSFLVAARLRQTGNQGPSRRPCRQGRRLPGPCARRLRNSRVPRAGSSKPTAHASESGLVRIPARRAGSLGAMSYVADPGWWTSRAGPGANPSRRGRERWRTGALRDPCPQRCVVCSTLRCARPSPYPALSPSRERTDAGVASVRPPAPRHGRQIASWLRHG